MRIDTRTRDWRQSLIFITLVGTLAFASTGCTSNSGHRDLELYVAELKAKPAGRITPVPEFKTYESYRYGAFDFRDPFTAPAGGTDQSMVADGSGVQPDRNRNKEPLEQFPLDTLKFVGHLEREGEKWAIITAPDKLVHKVSQGNHLGQNYGKIVGVSETSIDIVEIITDGIGGWIERQAALSLKE